MLMEITHGGITMNDLEDMPEAEFERWVEGAMAWRNVGKKNRVLEDDWEQSKAEAMRLQPPPDGWKPLTREMVRRGK